MTRQRRREQRLEEGGGRRPAGIPAMSNRGMDFVSFLGRVLFVSIFVLSTYQEASVFGSDGGPAAKSLEPKFNLFVKMVSTKTGMAVPHVEIKTVTAATLYLRAFGSALFILNSRFGAFLLRVDVFYQRGKRHVGLDILLVYLLFITPVVMMYGFNNYERESPESDQLRGQFSQNLALYGALLFFWGMKNLKDMSVKTETTSRTSKTKKA